jgi:hypothetical protein
VEPAVIKVIADKAPIPLSQRDLIENALGHCIRNSIAHGFTPAAERIAQGKILTALLP